VDVDPGIGSVTGGEERDALGVIPVQVPEQQGTLERRVAEQLADTTEPGPAVHEQLRAPRAVMGDGDA
jgi:hypothetical protein